MAIHAWNSVHSSEIKREAKHQKLNKLTIKIWNSNAFDALSLLLAKLFAGCGEGESWSHSPSSFLSVFRPFHTTPRKAVAFGHGARIRRRVWSFLALENRATPRRGGPWPAIVLCDLCIPLRTA